MLKHCVFVNFRDEVSKQEQRSILASFEELVDLVDGMLDYSSGENLDFENKSQEYSGGFIITFKNQEALEVYAQHPKHKELGGRLVEKSKGGHAGIIVFDIQAD